MGFFSRKMAEKPPVKIVVSPVEQLIGRLNWTIESHQESRTTLLVPKRDEIVLRCHIKEDRDVYGKELIDIEIDAGIRLTLRHFSYRLSMSVLYSNGVTRFGSFRVRNCRQGQVSLSFGGIYAPSELSLDRMMYAIAVQIETFHHFIHLQIKNTNLYFPVDFMGFPSEVLSIRIHRS